MESKANYTVVGVFVIAGLLGIFAFSFWLAGNSEGESYESYTVYFEESVSGLSEGGSVRYRGVNVGTVEKIRIDEQDKDLVNVTISVLEKTPVSQNTKAQLKFQGITGLAFIELVGESKGAKLSEKSEDGYLIIESDSSELAKLFASTPQLIENVNEITTRLNLLLSIENIDGVTTTIKNMKSLSTALGGETDNVQTLVSESTKTVREFKNVAKNFNAASKELSKMSKGVSEIVGDSKNNVINFSNSGLRAITRFFTEGRKTAEELRDTAKTLKENPSSILYPEADSKGNANEK